MPLTLRVAGSFARVVAEIAQRKGVKVLALTDHNSSLNCPAFAKTCPSHGILPIFGMEATTREEVHILCLFTSLEACMSFNEYAYSILMPLSFNPDNTGDQVFVDEDDNIEGKVENYLVNPLDIAVEEIGFKVAFYGGIVIPAHVDRSSFSIYSQFGIVVRGPWAALECTRLPPEVGGRRLDTLGFPLITSSDAHYREHVSSRPFELDASIEELAPRGLSGEADMAVLKSALERRPVYNYR